MKIFLHIILVLLLFSNPVSASTKTAEMLYAEAYGHLYKNNPDLAEKILLKSVEYYPDASFLYAGLGDTYLKKNNLEKAIEYYSKAQNFKDTNDIYKVDYYNTHVSKTMQEIEDVKNKLIEIAKNNNSSIIYQNLNHIMNEEYGKTNFETKMYLNSTNPALISANKLKANGDLEKALKEYLKILSNNYKDFQAGNNAGVTLLELKDYTLAEKYLKSALKYNQDSALILNNLAVVLLHEKKYDEMESCFKKIVETNPNYLPTLNNIQIARIYKNLFFYTNEDINTLIDIANKNNQNYYATITLSKIYSIKGDFLNGNNIISKINSEYNNYLYFQKSYLAYKEKKFDEALTYINKAISLYSDNATDYLLKARILYALGEYSNAKEVFAIGLNKNKKLSDFHFYNALNEYQLGNLNHSEALMAKFMQQNNNIADKKYFDIFFKQK